MRSDSTDDVIDLLNGCSTAAALGAALELGLFSLLEREGPLPARRVSQATGVPGRRCRYWLELLLEAGLLDVSAGTTAEDGPAYAASRLARRSLLETYSASTWAFLAQEARERSSFLDDFARQLRGGLEAAGSDSPSLETGPDDYVTLMGRDPERARRFTRMLYEIHLPLAEQLAEPLASRLDAGGGRRLLDLGGGSGVVVMPLLRRRPSLTAVVMDIPTVCAAGREIAEEQGLAGRIAFHPGDFARDELPGSFDLVLECDVDVYGEDLFRRVRASLAPGGRFVIVDQLAPAPGVAPRGRLHWALENALADPEFAFPTAAEVTAQLAAAGFAVRSIQDLPPPPGAPPRFSGAAVMIEAVPA